MSFKVIIKNLVDEVVEEFSEDYYASYDKNRRMLEIKEVGSNNEVVVWFLGADDRVEIRYGKE